MPQYQKYSNIRAFNFQTGDFEPLQLRTIGYRLDRRTGNYILVYTNPDFSPTSRYARQEVVVLADFFAAIVPEAVKSDVYAGCIDVTPAQFQSVGFIIHRTEEGGKNAVTA